MREPSIKDLEITIAYQKNPSGYGVKEGFKALATIMYCNYMGVTPKELLKTIQQRLTKN